jgi:hypothetical protein
MHTSACSVFALCLLGCGASANNYDGQPLPNELPTAIVSAQDAGVDQVEAPTSCIQGTWWLHFVPSDCPLCSCQPSDIPTSSIIQIASVIPVLNCETELASITNDHRCTYQASNKCQLMNGDVSLEWNGQIVFQRYSGLIGREIFYETEVGIGFVLPGGSHCPLIALLTKVEE